MTKHPNAPAMGIEVQRQAESGRWIAVYRSASYTEAVAVKTALEALHKNTEFRTYEPAAIHRHADDAKRSLLLCVKIAHTRKLFALADAMDSLATDVEEAIQSFDLALLAEDEAITEEKGDG